MRARAGCSLNQLDQKAEEEKQARGGETAKVEANRINQGDKGKNGREARRAARQMDEMDNEEKRRAYINARTYYRYKKNENASTAINCARLVYERLIIIG